MLSTKKPTAIKQADEYLYHCEFVKRRAATTIKTYRKDLSNFIRRVQLKDFQRLTNQQITAWQAELVAEGKTGKTVNNNRDSLVGCLKYLGKHGYKIRIDFDLVDRADEDHREALYFTTSEIGTIKGACVGLRELLLVSLLYDSGMRISEVVSLCVESISGLQIKVVQGKGRKDRWVFIRQPTRDLLDQWLAKNDITSGYVFPSSVKFDDPLSHQQIRGSINAAIRRAGFKKGSAHTMRHSFATDFINSGADIFTVQTILGHSDPKVTRRYFHTNAEQLGEKYAKFFGAVEKEPV